MIYNKKQGFLKKKTQSICMSKELGESLIYLGMPSETLISIFSEMKVNDAFT